MRTILTFKSSAFNTTQEKDHFVNPGCYGDDLARWFMQNLRSAGYDTCDEPIAEDFGWALSFEHMGKGYFIVICRLIDDEVWQCAIERKTNFLFSVLGLSRFNIAPEALTMLHGLLESAEEVSDLHWMESDSEEQHQYPV